VPRCEALTCCWQILAQILPVKLYSYLSSKFCIVLKHQDLYHSVHNLGAVDFRCHFHTTWPFTFCGSKRRPDLGRLFLSFTNDTHTHTHTHSHTSGRTPLNELSFRRTGCYLQNTQHERRTSVPSAEFEPAIPAIERRQSYTLDRTATGFGLDDIYSGLQMAVHS